MTTTVPIAISYQPKTNDYLPVVVAAIRRHLGDWPIVLVTQESELPPSEWLKANAIDTITDWHYSEDANKVQRLWEHQAILGRYFESWIWWHDDMLLLKPLRDPIAELDSPLIRTRERERPNKQLGNWHRWLWDTLNFFKCQNIAAPNPVLHTPRLIEREVVASIPHEWRQDRLLFEPTYLLWKWHLRDQDPERAIGYRKSVFKGEVPSITELVEEGYTFLNWGKEVDPLQARRVFGAIYPVDF